MPFNSQGSHVCAPSIRHPVRSRPSHTSGLCRGGIVDLDVHHTGKVLLSGARDNTGGFLSCFAPFLSAPACGELTCRVAPQCGSGTSAAEGLCTLASSHLPPDVRQLSSILAVFLCPHIRSPLLPVRARVAAISLSLLSVMPGGITSVQWIPGELRWLICNQLSDMHPTLFPVFLELDIAAEVCQSPVRCPALM